MDYIVNDEKVQAGDKILTSGEDHIFPKDLPIGKVESTKPGNPFQVIWIEPAARLDRLEEVLILLSQQELTPKKPEEAPAASGTNSGATKAVQPTASHQ
jgi:cell shape-determining protein MreC